MLDYLHKGFNKQIYVANSKIQALKVNLNKDKTEIRNFELTNEKLCSFDDIGKQKPLQYLGLLFDGYSIFYDQQRRDGMAKQSIPAPTGNTLPKYSNIFSQLFITKKATNYFPYFGGFN